MAKYSFTYKDQLIALEKAKCSMAQLRYTDIQTAKTNLPTKKNQELADRIYSAYWALAQYNYPITQITTDDSNCLTEEQASFLIQRINELTGLCPCNSSISVVVPEVTGFRLTEDGDFRITEDGYTLKL